MLYWKFSPNRIFFLNEYWIFIPSAIVANYFIIGKIRSNKARLKQLKELKEQLERAEKLRKILLLSLGLSSSANIYLLQRAGADDIIDIDYIRMKCTIEEGIRYLDDNRLRQILHDLYKSKAKRKVIYVTSTALCHVANQYGKQFLALPVAIGDFGLTNALQFSRKFLVTVLLGGVGPLITAGGSLYLGFAIIAALAGLRLANIDLDYIPTSPISTEEIAPRVPGVPEVVVLNNRNRDKIIMTKNKECWLPEQQMLNSNCQTNSGEIPVDFDLPTYDQTVNMQDVTGLHKQKFSDRYDVEGIERIENPKIKID